MFLHHSPYKHEKRIIFFFSSEIRKQQVNYMEDTNFKIYEDVFGSILSKCSSSNEVCFPGYHY